MSIAALQPDVNVWQYAGTEVYAWFAGTGSNSNFILSWDYAGVLLSTGNLDTVYVRQNTTGTEPWEFLASRWNDQSHHIHAAVLSFGTGPVVFGLQNRNGAGSEVTDSVASEILVRAHYINTSSLASASTTGTMSWTVTGNKPASLTGFYVMAAVDLPTNAYAQVAAADFDELGTGFVSPVGESGNFYAFVVGHDSSGKHITLITDIKTAMTQQP